MRRAAVHGSQVRCKANLYALRGRSRLAEGKQQVWVKADWMKVEEMGDGKMRESL